MAVTDTVSDSLWTIFPKESCYYLFRLAKTYSYEFEEENMNEMTCFVTLF